MSQQVSFTTLILNSIVYVRSFIGLLNAKKFFYAQNFLFVTMMCPGGVFFIFIFLWGFLSFLNL